jgi:hypothetical protein
MLTVTALPGNSRLKPSEPVLGDRRETPTTPAPPPGTTRAPPPGTTAAPPAATPSAVQAAGAATVKLSVSLPMTLAAFNSSVQQTFKEVMAVAAGLARSDSGRVALAMRDGGRRLLAASVGVDVTISMPDAASAKAAVAALTADKINSGLAGAGLPRATITTPAAVVTTGSSAAAAGARAALAWAALAAAAAAVRAAAA